jgi:hypothetical protein
MASSSYSLSNDTQSTQRLIQSITVNIQKIAQNGKKKERFKTLFTNLKL